jgi:hypothetical protein
MAPLRCIKFLEEAMANSILQVEAYDTEVCRIVEDVLLTMTGYAVIPSGGAYTDQPGRTTCAVYFSGEWSGAVFVGTYGNSDADPIRRRRM